MFSIERTIGDSALKRIRAKRSVPGDGKTGASTPSNEAKSGKVSVREATFSDFAQVSAMNRGLGQGPDSMENWIRLWKDNPALAYGRRANTIGWLLEDKGKVMGFLGSVPLVYEMGGKELRAAATCRFAVEPAYRALSHLMVASFLRQKDVDVFLNTTATVSAGKIMTALKATTLPQPDYDTVLFWVLNTRRFSVAVLKKMGVSSGLAASGGAVGSLALRTDIAIRKRKPRNSSARAPVVEMGVNDLSEGFDQFVTRKKRESDGLFASRSSAIMRWHFLAPSTNKVTRVLAIYLGKDLIGYAIVQHEKEGRNTLRRTLVADLLAIDDNPQIIEQLIVAAYNSARVAQSDVLEVMGFPQRVRQILLRSKPYTRKYPAHPFFYKVHDEALKERLKSQDAWYACPYDGDGTIWP